MRKAREAGGAKSERAPRELDGVMNHRVPIMFRHQRHSEQTQHSHSFSGAPKIGSCRDASESALSKQEKDRAMHLCYVHCVDGSDQRKCKRT